MKNTLLVISLILTTIVSAQTVVTTPLKWKHTCSQKFGISSTEESYNLIVSYTNENISFKTRESQNGSSYNIAKKTAKYIIGKTSEGNYLFYDIKRKQLFYIDYFMSRYTTAGYGSPSQETKQKVLKMMEILKDKKSQKDVIQYLITQSEFDF